MKLFRKIAGSVLILTVVLSVILLGCLKTTNASNVSLSAGREVSITNLNGNLNNINIKVEFTTSVNLDGENNALLIGFAASDDTILTDERFIVSSTKTGVFDSDDIAMNFENTLATVGTKTSSGSNYKYQVETRDFSVINGEKNIAKMVVIGQKGDVISTEITFSEVKYTVQFKEESAKSYSYNALIEAPSTTPPSYQYDFDGHKKFFAWMGNDSQTFVYLTTKATKDIIFNPTYSLEENHSWQDVLEVSATETQTGVLAHQECKCGAKRLNSSSSTLITDLELEIPKLHVHSYEASISWDNVEKDGDKPVITYTCSLCHESVVIDDDEVSLVEKSGTRTPATLTTNGKVTYIASCSYQGVDFSSEKEIILPALSYEEAQVISVGNLTQNSHTVGLSVSPVNDQTYTYEATTTNKSVIFKFNFVVKNKWNADSDGSQVIFGPTRTNEGVLWFRPDAVFLAYNNADGLQYKKLSNGMPSAGTYLVEYGRLAIMDGITFTGNYKIYAKVNDTLVGEFITSADTILAKNGNSALDAKITIEALKGNTIDDCFMTSNDTVEEANVYSLNDITNNLRLFGGEYKKGGLTGLNSGEFSTIFKCLVSPTKEVTTDSRIEITLSGDTYDGCKFFIGNGHENYEVFFAYALSGKPTDRYYLDNDKTTVMEVGEIYEIEQGRIVVKSGVHAGKDLVYLKINGSYVYNAGVGSIFFVDHTSYPLDELKVNLKIKDFAVMDIDYVKPTLEQATEFSMSDLKLDGTTPITSPYSPTENFRANYSKDFNNNSAIFHFIMNITSNEQLAQIGFEHWKNRMMIWNNGANSDPGTCINLEDGTGWLGGGYYPELNVDHDMEFGCVKVLSGTGAGKYLVYLKADGNMIVEALSDTTAEGNNSIGVLSFNGIDGNPGKVTFKDARTYRLSNYDDLIETSMSLAYTYDLSDSKNNDFRLQVAISEIAKIIDADNFGIEVKADGKTIYLSDDKIHLDEDNGIFYSIIDLGDVLANNASNANIEFSIRAYFETDGIKEFGTNIKTYSVKSIVKTYYETYHIEVVKGLYDILFPNEE